MYQPGALIDTAAKSVLTDPRHHIHIAPRRE